MTIVTELRRRQRLTKLAQNLTKEAVSDAGKAFLYTLGGGLASAGVAYGVPAALESVNNAKVRVNKEKYLSKMRSAHPEIKNYSKKDIDLVYNSLSMHAPRVLKDPLVGGQVVLEALRRGNHMDLGQLNNVSKMTGGSGITEHQRDAANIMAQQVGRASENYAKSKFDSRVSDQVMIEKVKGQELRETKRFEKMLGARGDMAAARSRRKFIQDPKGAGAKGSAREQTGNLYSAKARYRAYQKRKKS